MGDGSEPHNLVPSSPNAVIRYCGEELEAEFSGNIPPSETVLVRSVPFLLVEEKGGYQGTGSLGSSRALSEKLSFLYLGR